MKDRIINFTTVFNNRSHSLDDYITFTLGFTPLRYSGIYTDIVYDNNVIIISKQSNKEAFINILKGVYVRNIESCTKVGNFYYYYYKCDSKGNYKKKKEIMTIYYVKLEKILNKMTKECILL